MFLDVLSIKSVRCSEKQPHVRKIKNKIRRSYHFLNKCSEKIRSFERIERKRFKLLFKFPWLFRNLKYNRKRLNKQVFFLIFQWLKTGKQNPQIKNRVKKKNTRCFISGLGIRFVFLLSLVEG